MKFKKYILFSLLFVFSLNIVHEYIINLADNKKCNAIEYIHEVDKPINVGDICDIHYEYHHPYILPSLSIVLYLPKISYTPHIKISSFTPQIIFEHFKPPKA